MSNIENPLVSLIKQHQSHFAPLLGEPYLSAEKIFLDLTKTQEPLLDFKGSNQQVSIGKYAENRANLYPKSSFRNRSIHLGLDIELPEDTPLFLPYQGKIIASKDNHGQENTGDYGPTLIIQHELENQTFYSLYGHLSQATLTHAPKGKIFKTGECFGYIGKSLENGGWPSHVHVQLILKLSDFYRKKEDYPGVCAALDKQKYLENSPDPSDFVGIFF
jgi:murein DD-endopeptidase MepM/ murein hydrolase activator NlpD